jgi:hypothetical protein
MAPLVATSLLIGAGAAAGKALLSKKPKPLTTSTAPTDPAATQPRGPRITPLGSSDVLRIDPRRRKALRGVLAGDSVLSDKLG